MTTKLRVVLPDPLHEILPSAISFLRFLSLIALLVIPPLLVRMHGNGKSVAGMQGDTNLFELVGFAGRAGIDALNFIQTLKLAGIELLLCLLVVLVFKLGEQPSHPRTKPPMSITPAPLIR